MMEDNKQLALRIDGAVQSASQEVTNLRAELTATNRRLAELSGGGGPGPGPGAAASASAAADSAAANMENHQHSAQGRDRLAPGAEERRASQTRRCPGTRCPPRPRRNRLALWLVTLSARRWPVLLPCWELQSAVINENPGAACTGSHGHGGPGQRKLGAAGGYPPGSRKCPLDDTQPTAPWANFSCPGLCRGECHSFPPVPEAPFLGTTAQEGAPGSAAAFGVEDWTGLHFSPRMPNPLSRLHLDFIFSPFEIAQAVELYQCNSRCCAQQGIKISSKYKH